jgi:hypothetical protein
MALFTTVITTPILVRAYRIPSRPAWERAARRAARDAQRLPLVSQGEPMRDRCSTGPARAASRCVPRMRWSHAATADPLARRRPRRADADLPRSRDDPGRAGQVTLVYPKYIPGEHGRRARSRISSG